MEARYFRPRSLTWWAGAGAIGSGVLGIVQPENAALVEITSAFIGTGNASPALLITTGLGMIGIRDKLERREPE